MSSDDWPLLVDGDEYYSVPESWIEHGTDTGSGSPRIYAVSVADGVRNIIKLRYATRDGRVVEVDTSGTDNPTKESGTVPAELATKGTWSRSMVPGRGVEPSGVLREPERIHFAEIWSDRLERVDGATRDDRLVADGGRPESEETVYIPAQNQGSDNDHFHTDRECPALENARKVHQYPRSSLEDHRDECARCADEVDTDHSYNRDYYSSVVDADPEVVSLD